MNPNNCSTCMWKVTHDGWCHWWFTEPEVKCLYDKGRNYVEK